MTSTWQERGYYEGLHTKRQGCKARRGGAGQAVLNRIAALESGLASVRRSLAGKLDLNNVTQGTAVTEPGWAADARELNAAFAGTLANRAQGLSQRMNKLFAPWQGVDDADTAPDGVCLLHADGANNPFQFVATLLTFTGENPSYRQQLALPWGAGESHLFAYRTMDLSVWYAWKKFQAGS